MRVFSDQEIAGMRIAVHKAMLENLRRNIDEEHGKRKKKQKKRIRKTRAVKFVLLNSQSNEMKRDNFIWKREK